MMKISVIIASYNRGAQLMRTLSSLLPQTLDYNLWEVIAVDNNSSDNTKELFEKFKNEKAKAFNMRMVFEGRQGLSHARNRGVAESTGEYIAIIDDDEEVNPEFLEQYVTFFDTHSDAAAAGGRMVPLYEYKTPKWLSHYVERPLSSTINLGNRIKVFKGERYPIGGNMAFRRTIIDKVGSFNPELGRTGTKLLGGEEKDMFRRIRDQGGKIYWLPGPTALHIIPESRLTRDYLVRLSKMIGISERTRTLSVSKWSYAKRIFAEAVKWGGTAVIIAGYTLCFQPAKAGYLFILRWNITRGLLGTVKQ